MLSKAATVASLLSKETPILPLGLGPDRFFKFRSCRIHKVVWACVSLVYKELGGGGGFGSASCIPKHQSTCQEVLSSSCSSTRIDRSAAQFLMNSIGGESSIVSCNAGRCQSVRRHDGTRPAWVGCRASLTEITAKTSRGADRRSSPAGSRSSVTLASQITTMLAVSIVPEGAQE